MPEVININTSKGLVKFSQDDLIEHDLHRWVRTSFKGVGTQKLLAEYPFEKTAARLYHEKFPDYGIKFAEKCLMQPDGSVDVILKIAKCVAEDRYNSHPSKQVYSKKPKGK